MKTRDNLVDRLFASDTASALTNESARYIEEMYKEVQIHRGMMGRLQNILHNTFAVTHEGETESAWLNLLDAAAVAAATQVEVRNAAFDEAAEKAKTCPVSVWRAGISPGNWDSSMGGSEELTRISIAEQILTLKEQSPTLAIADLSYTILFNAIAAAAKIEGKCEEGTAIAISVMAFEAEIARILERQKA